MKWWKSNLPYPSGFSVSAFQVIITTRDGRFSPKLDSLREKASQIRGTVAVIAAILVYVSVLVVPIPTSIRLVVATVGLILAFLSSIRIRLVASAEPVTVTTKPGTAKATTVSSGEAVADAEEAESGDNGGDGENCGC